MTMSATVRSMLFSTTLRSHSLTGHRSAHPAGAGRVHPLRGLRDRGRASARHRHTLYAKSFILAEISYPAEALVIDPVADYARTEHVSIDARTSRQLDVAICAGVEPARVILHTGSLSPNEIRYAAGVGVGRLIVSHHEHLDAIAGCEARRPHQILLGMGPCGFAFGSAAAEEAVLAVLGDPRLRLVGLDARVGVGDSYAGVVDRLIAQLSHIWRNHGVRLTRISIGCDGEAGDTVVDAARLAATIDDAVNDSCARHRFPRPLVIVAAGWDCVGMVKDTTALWEKD